MKNPFTKSRIAIALVAMLAIGGVAMAAPTIDTSTTDATTTVSELQDGDVIQMDANATENYSVESIVANSTTPNMKLVVNDTDNPADGDMVYDTTMTNETAGVEGSHWNGSFNEGDIADVPYSIDENVTLDVVVYNESDASDNVTFQITLDTDDTRSVAYVSDATAESNDDITVNTENGTQLPVVDYTVPGTANDNSEFEFERNKTTNTDEVVVVLADTNASEDFDSAFSDVDSESTESLRSALTGPVTVTKVDSTAVRAYNEALPSDLDADTTAVSYEMVGGQPALVYDVSNNDDSTVTVSGFAGGGLGAYINAYSLGGALSMGVLIVFGSTRYTREEDN